METPTDIFKQALRNEVHASAFFAKAADLTRDDASRMLFLELAGMEDGHAGRLVEKGQKAPCNHGFDMVAFLKELEGSVDPAIPPDEMAIIEQGDPKAVLRLAIDLEAKSMKTYARLADEAIDLEIKSFCLEQVKEEAGHGNALTKLLHSMDMDPEDRPGL
ncbi:MAG: ferritin family protein [Magnetococcales bacterium]|nr:ferritin family protein [Magnetococcales bacterium]